MHPVFFWRIAMEIHGLQKLTLLDFPGHTACTVFTGRCNFRCPFCQNASLVLRPESLARIPEEDVFAFLEKRRGLLDGVAVTGGEPTLQPDLPEFLRRVKDLGFETKLDTNGARPDVLRRILAEGLADYVAMDIKSSPAGYARCAGVSDKVLTPVRESAALLEECGIPHEFRTTAVKGLHSPADFKAIGEWLAGTEAYYIQSYADSGDILAPGFAAFSHEELEALLAAVQPYIPHALLRGVD
jgi:pyruvate formate lyase activating enzyme